MTDRERLRQTIEQEFDRRGIKAGDTVDSLSIVSLYEGTCSLSLGEIQSLVREVGRAKRVDVRG
jgi:hypothetical protein